MKMHIGVDDGLCLIHSIATTAANEHEITQTDKLLHGDEQRVWGDAGYLGVDKREEHKTRAADWFIAMGPGKWAKSDPLAQAEKNKGQRARKSGAHLFLYQARISLQQSPLSRAGEKHQSLVCVSGNIGQAPSTDGALFKKERKADRLLQLANLIRGQQPVYGEPSLRYRI
jgi:hypothetical protein